MSISTINFNNQTALTRYSQHLQQNNSGGDTPAVPQTNAAPVSVAPLSKEAAAQMSQITAQLTAFYGIKSASGLSSVNSVIEATAAPEPNAANAFERLYLNYSMDCVAESGSVGMGREQYRAYLEENGLGFDSKDFWRGVAGRLVLSEARAASDPGCLRLGGLENGLHEMASRYAYEKARFTARYEGAELETHLQALEDAFALETDFFAAGIADNFALHAGKYGIADESGKIKDSVAAAVRDLARQYTDFVEQNKDYAGIAGTDDAWLRDDDFFMTYQLRQAFAAQTPAGGADAADTETSLYTRTELVYLGRFLDELEKELTAAGFRQTSSAGEAMAGLTWGMAAMKAETVTRQAGVSENLRSALARVTAAFGGVLMDAIDRTNERYSRGMAYYPPVDRQAVMQIYQAAAQELLATGDVNQAHIKGWEKAIELNCYASTSYLSSYYRMGFTSGIPVEKEGDAELSYFLRYLETGADIRPVAEPSLEIMIAGLNRMMERINSGRYMNIRV
jgi:hypothetical protein